MSAASTALQTQGGDVVNRDKIIGGDEVRGNKYVTVLPGDRSRLFVGVPPMPQLFLGRAALVEELVNRLCAGQATALSADGLPGVGKTTLAVALARDARILDHFSDGVLWAGLGRTPDVASIQATWGDALATDLRDLLDPYARQQRLNSAIGDRRLLVVLDDLWQWEAAQQLRCSGPHTVTILTTRDQALARRFAGPQQSVTVPVLAPEPGYALLYALAPEACDTDPAAARRLAAQVDGLPLALELLGGYLGASSQRRTQARRHQALATLADPAARLALATERLGDQQHREVTLQETIALSLADLPAATVAAFYALGAFAPKPARFDLPAALAVTEADEETLFTLADRNLVEMGEDETLALHQTLSALARTQLLVEAVSLHRGYYLSIVEEDKEDWQRIEAIYEQISFAWTQLSATNVNNIRFVDRLSTFQTRRGLWQERLQWLAHALNAARHGQDQQAEARMLNAYGYAYSALGDKALALVYYEQALAQRRQLDDKVGEVVTVNNIGLLYADLGKKKQALDHYEQALTLSHKIGNKANNSRLLNNIGRVYDDLGERKRALDYYELALPLWRQMDDKAGEAITLNNIGCIYNTLGDKKHTLTYYKQALALFCVIGDKTHEASTLNNIGSIYSALSDNGQALAYYKQALLLCHQAGNKEGEAATLNNLALLAYGEGRITETAKCLEEVIDIFHNLGATAEEATVLSNLAQLWQIYGNPAKARRLMIASLAILEHYRLPQDAMGETTAQKETFLVSLAVEES